MEIDCICKCEVQNAAMEINCICKCEVQNAEIQIDCICECEVLKHENGTFWRHFYGGFFIDHDQWRRSMGVIYPQKFTSGTRPPANSGLLLWTLFCLNLFFLFLESFFKTTQQSTRGGGGTSGAYPEELNASRLVPYGGPPPDNRSLTMSTHTTLERELRHGGPCTDTSRGEGAGPVANESGGRGLCLFSVKLPHSNHTVTTQ